jgi:putative ABC transport system permease protein
MGVRVTMLVHICGRRLRLHTGQELLAGSGIAVGVALVFGVLVANTSLTSSAGALIHQVIGSARLELAARSPEGFDVRLAEQAQTLPDVAASAAVLRSNVTLVGPRGRSAVQMLGVNAGIAALGGLEIRDFRSLGHVGPGLLLPGSVAQAIGATAGRQVRVMVGGSVRSVPVGAILETPLFGALGSSPVTIALLPLAQQLTGLANRVTLVLVRPRRGADARLARELARLAGGRLDVVPADNELRLLDQAVKPNNQSTALFAALSVMVGFLLALCATLLTIPERRRFIADLRMQGYDWRQALLIVGSEALVLGLIASAGGVALGYVLSHVVLHRVPAYLASAFPIGSQEIVPASIVALAMGSGVLATAFASLPLAFDLNPRRPRDAVYRSAGAGSESVSRALAFRLGWTGVALGLVTTVLVLAFPGLTLGGGVALALVTLCVIPATFAAAAGALVRGSERLRGGALVLAARELSGVSTRLVALAGIAALAVYGSVAVGSAQRDLLRGLDQAIVQQWSAAQVWVTPDPNIFDADGFRVDGALSTLARAPGVSSVRVHQGGFLDYGDHRLWIRAMPPQGPTMVLPSQLVRGELARANRLLREGGWATVSTGFAEEHHLHVGQSFALPTPSGSARFGVAAITTNIGWPSGTITLSTSDFSRRWETREPTTLAIGFRPGIDGQTAKRTVAAALGPGRGLRVQTSAERIGEVERTVREGLRSLRAISTLLVIAAALAVAAALSAVIWQRRPRLASMKIQGYDRRQLWRALLLESATVLAIGCAVGALLGVYGHALASRALIRTTGFPAPFSLDPPQIAITLALLASIAMAVIALPGLLAARVSARASFHE